ncbi:hypothetical protein [Dysgonomonas sp. 520]|uniref:hypothetical protein n=1 Tax=Dysgonomonas sp. 520 TaxID=2302931 RepID=UPI001C879E1B|nr:hypothetical protein [Dysgonomonas sp. 520]NDW09836.1 hypothetical protein [Dysgonomonas sp. 520]
MVINTDIATIIDSNQITLVNNPSFIRFIGKNDDSSDIPTFEMSVNFINGDGYFVIQEANTEIKHTFKGTRNKNLILNNSDMFYVSENNSITANNIAACLLRDGWFKASFDISTEGNKIMMVGKMKNPNYSFSISEINNIGLSYNTPDYVITNNNSLYNSTIELDVYNADTNRFITTVTKSFIDGEVWFDINNIMNRTMVSYPNLLFNTNRLVDSGSSISYNYKSKRTKDYEIEYFYTSGKKYVVDGFKRTLEENNLDEYIYNPLEDNKVNILTNNTNRYYNVGEDITANFIYNDYQLTDDFKIGCLIKYYENTRLVKEDIIAVADNYHLVNSIYITADKIELTEDTQYFDVVFVKIPTASTTDYYEISTSVRYTILDVCNTTKGFLFLNKLGGWDCYYFNSDFSNEFKTDATTSFKTLQPEYKVSDSYQKVERKDVSETFIIKSMVTKDIAEWLKELSTSKYVYSIDDENRYVIVNDFDLSVSDKDLFEVTMKYTLADSYNTNIK